MPKADKPRCGDCGKRPKRRQPQFKKRICVRLDDDVIALGNASFETVEWDSVAHAVNASIRRALMQFKPAGVLIRIDPFEQLVFARKLRCHRTTRCTKSHTTRHAK